MDKLYFKNIIDIGNLYLKYIFLKFDMEPIFFICVDDRQQLYLCFCSEIREEQRWIISACDIGTLQALIKNEIDIASALCVSERLIVVTKNLQEKEHSVIIRTKEVDPLDLPRKGTMLRCNQKETMNHLII